MSPSPSNDVDDETQLQQQTPGFAHQHPTRIHQPLPIHSDSSRANSRLARNFDYFVGRLGSPAPEASEGGASSGANAKSGSGFSFGNKPFTFNMPVPQTPPVVASEPMAVDSDSRPISPNAARRAQLRRHNNRASLTASVAALFGLAKRTPGSSTNHNRNNRNNNKNGNRGRRRGAEDSGSNGWITDDGESGNSSAGDASSHRSAAAAASQESHGSRRRLRSRGGRAGTRRESEGASTRGVNRVLALMGSRVDEPTTVERLQMHRDIPYVISGYLQLGFNVFMVGMVLTIITNVLLTIQRDVNAKVQEYSAVVMQEIGACSKQYVENRCAPELRVPAMEKACNMWDTCMHQDPTKVGRAKVSAETLAGIVNGFIEPLSLKTMLFFLLLFFGTLFVSNFAFGAYRHSRVHQQYMNQSAAQTVVPTASASAATASTSYHRRDRSRSHSRSRSSRTGSVAPTPATMRSTSRTRGGNGSVGGGGGERSYQSNAVVLSSHVRRRN
ncbi:hypothetical protein GGI07_002460 [Coemansia sp. Benny D115]|nr:hypothetical protein GGI07_002460 [Coemansia sp. Benny D115]